MGWTIPNHESRHTMQVYSDPTRESDPHALPDVEVFYVSQAVCLDDRHDEPCPQPCSECDHDCEPERMEIGYYWWSCFPGCSPDSEPFGPYDTEAEAVDAAQDI